MEHFVFKILIFPPLVDFFPFGTMWKRATFWVSRVPWFRTVELCSFQFKSGIEATCFIIFFPFFFQVKRSWDLRSEKQFLLDYVLKSGPIDRQRLHYLRVPPDSDVAKYSLFLKVANLTEPKQVETEVRRAAVVFEEYRKQCSPSMKIKEVYDRYASSYSNLEFLPWKMPETEKKPAETDVGQGEPLGGKQVETEAGEGGAKEDGEETEKAGPSEVSYK